MWLSIACTSCAGFGHKSFCLAELWKCDSTKEEVQDVEVTVLSSELRIKAGDETRTIPLDAVCFRPAEEFSVRPGDVAAEPYLDSPGDFEDLELSPSSESVQSQQSFAYRCTPISIEPERVPMQTIAPEFYWTLGTGIGDPEKDANWTSAAIFPLGSESVEPPSIRIQGQTNREEEFIQFMPGFFWCPDEEIQFTVGVPLGLSETAPDWGLLFALNY